MITFPGLAKPRLAVIRTPRRLSSDRDVVDLSRLVLSVVETGVAPHLRLAPGVAQDEVVRDNHLVEGVRLPRSNSSSMWSHCPRRCSVPIKRGVRVDRQERRVVLGAAREDRLTVLDIPEIVGMVIAISIEMRTHNPKKTTVGVTIPTATLFPCRTGSVEMQAFKVLFTIIAGLLFRPHVEDPRKTGWPEISSLSKFCASVNSCMQMTSQWNSSSM